MNRPAPRSSSILFMLAAATTLGGIAVAQTSGPDPDGRQGVLDPTPPGVPPGDGISIRGEDPEGQAFTPPEYNVGIGGHIYPPTTAAPPGLIGGTYPPCRPRQVEDRCVQTYSDGERRAATRARAARPDLRMDPSVQTATRPEVPDDFNYIGTSQPASVRYPSGHKERSKPQSLPADPSAVQAPPGYEVQVVAQGLDYPTDITFGRNGEIYVSEAGGHTYGTAPPNAPEARILQIMPGGQQRVLYQKTVPLDVLRKVEFGKPVPAEGIVPPLVGVTYNASNGLLYVASRQRYATLNPETGEWRRSSTDCPHGASSSTPSQYSIATERCGSSNPRKETAAR